MKFTVHRRENVPEPARETVSEIIDAWGFLPNLGAVMAESPAALDLLWAGYAALSAKATLSPVEQQLVCVVASRENGCGYRVAAHSTMALWAKMTPGVLRAAREGAEIDVSRLNALRVTTERLVRQRGWLSEADKEVFVAAGYQPGQLLEIIGWISMKLLTNYTNHVADPPVDVQWSAQAWDPPAR